MWAARVLARRVGGSRFLRVRGVLARGGLARWVVRVLGKGWALACG